ncbi:MAG: hypothetical protein JOY82_18440 [Streptosporangiaceae bacterium]|nr:hypothetical protein [Streptosporangiaceae bacterium]
MITALTRRLPVRVAALLAVAMLMVAALTAGLTYSFSGRYAAASNGVINTDGILAHNGVINADGIQGSG